MGRWSHTPVPPFQKIEFFTHLLPPSQAHRRHLPLLLKFLLLIVVLKGFKTNICSLLMLHCL